MLPGCSLATQRICAYVYMHGIPVPLVLQTQHSSAFSGEDAWIRQHVCRQLLRASMQTTVPQHSSRSQILSLGKLHTGISSLGIILSDEDPWSSGELCDFLWLNCSHHMESEPRGPFLGSVSREISLFILAKLLSIMCRRNTCPEDNLHGMLWVYSVSQSLPVLTHGLSRWTVSMLWISSYFACLLSVFNSRKDKYFHWKNINSFISLWFWK